MASAIGVVFVRHRHRQTFIELSRAERARDDLNIEFGRLQLEQATWAESNRVDQVARARHVPRASFAIRRHHDLGHDLARRDGAAVRPHQQRRRGLVAADGQHHAVERIAIEHLDEAEIGKVAVERRSRAAAIFEDRVDGKLDSDSARVPDTILNP